MAEMLANPSLTRSPFAALQDARAPNPSGQIGVHVLARRCASVNLISTWVHGGNALEAALGAALGSPVPGTPGQTSRCAHGLLLRTGPVEFLLMGEDPSERTTLLRAAVKPEVGSVTDLSHARCKISVSGPQCRAMLNKLFALDLREREFPPGEARMTGTHHVPCTLHRLESDRFDLYVFTTYAQDQLETVLDAALEYGYALSLG